MTGVKDEAGAGRRRAVLFVAHGYPHGLVFHLARLAAALHEACRQRGLSFHMASVQAERNPGTWAFVRSRLPPSSLLECADFTSGLQDHARRLLETHDEVVVHCGGGWQQTRVLGAVRGAARGRMLLVSTTHSYRHDSWRRPFVSAVLASLYLRHTDHVVFQCPYAASQFVGSGLLLRGGRASIIPLGVEEMDTTRQSPPGPCGESDLESLLGDTTTFNFVYLAEFRPGKGHVWMVETLAPVLKRHPAARLLLLGGGQMLPTVRARAAALGVARQVVTPGRVPRSCVPWVLGRCHCGLVTSRAETFGHNYVEPMMAGLPVIGTRVGAGEYLIQDYLTGIGFPWGNQDACRTAAAYMAGNPGEAAGMGQQARQLVSRICSFEAIAEAHARLYARLLERIQPTG